MEMNNKLREALVRIENLADDYEQCGTKAGALDDIYEIARAALAEPIKNCDVGTAEEQEMRLDKFCHAQKMDGFECQCPCFSNGRCNHLVWAQMPYAPVDCPPSYVPDQEGKQGGEPCALTNQ